MGITRRAATLSQPATAMMNSSKHYTARQSADGKWFYTWPATPTGPAGKCSGWKYQGQCQRQADDKKREHARQPQPA